MTSTITIPSYDELLGKIKDILDNHFSSIYLENIQIFDATYFLSHYTVIYEMVSFHHHALSETFDKICDHMNRLYHKYNDSLVSDTTLATLISQHRHAILLRDSLSMIFFPIVRLKLDHQTKKIETYMETILWESFIHPHLTEYTKEIKDRIRKIMENTHIEDYQKAIPSSLEVEMMVDVIQILCQYSKTYTTDISSLYMELIHEILNDVSENYDTSYTLHHFIEQIIITMEVIQQINSSLQKRHNIYCFLRRPISFPLTSFLFSRECVFLDLKDSLLNMDEFHLLVINAIIQRGIPYIKYDSLHQLLEQHVAMALQEILLRLQETETNNKNPYPVFFKQIVNQITKFILFIKQVDAQTFHVHYTTPLISNWLLSFCSMTTVSDLMTRWFHMLIEMDDFDISQYTYVFFDFFHKVDDQDVFLEKWITLCKKRFLRHQFHITKDPLLVFVLENNYGINNGSVYKYSKMVKEIMSNKEIFEEVECLIVSTSIWGVPEMPQDILIHPLLCEHLQVFETLYLMKYERRKITWDYFYTMVHLQLDSCDIHLPFFAANEWLFRIDKQPPSLSFHSQFFGQYLEEQGLLMLNSPPSPPPHDTMTTVVAVTTPSILSCPIPSRKKYWMKYREFLEKQPSDSSKSVNVEPSVVQRQLEEERKDVVQAKIVKIVKREKKIEIDKLRQWTREEITLFRLTDTFFMKQVEALEEREYIGRNECHNLIYIHYLTS